MRREESLNEIPANGRTDMTGYREREALPQPGQQIDVRRGRLRVLPRPRGDRNPVPPERFFFGSPLPLEVIGARIPRRSAEVEPGAALVAGRLDRFPVEE